FLGRKFRLALGRDFADENIAGLHFRPDADDAAGVKVLERLVAEVWYVPRDLLGPELGVTGADLEFVNVDRSEHVVLDDAFADQNRILEVVAVPRHEGAEHI